jgi:hypothetical protein
LIERTDFPTVQLPKLNLFSKFVVGEKKVKRKEKRKTKTNVAAEW